MLNFLPSLFGAASSFLPTDEAPPPAPSAFQFRPRPLSTPAPQMGADPASYDAAYASWMQGLLNGTGATGTMTGVDSALAGFQGVADQMLGRPGQLGQSSDYYAGLTSGGTGAQNARFERMYDPRFAQEAAAQSLAVDPQFGHLFGGGNAGVTQLGGPVPGTVDDTYSEVAGRLKSDYSPSSAGYKMGGLAGVKLSPELQSHALQNRLDQRADSAAALENMRVGPMDFVNPLDRMAAAYEWEAMNREFQAQQEKNLLAKTLAQAEIDAQIAATKESGRQFDANLGYRKQQGWMQGLGSFMENATEQARWKADYDLKKAALDAEVDAAERTGQLSQKDLLGLLLSESAMGMGGPAEMLKQIGGLGLSIPGLPSLPQLGAPTAGTSEPPIRRPTPAQSEAWGAMPLEQQVIAMQDAGWTEDQILARLQQTQPGGFGITLDNPDGSSAAWEMARAFPGLPMFYDDAFFGSGFQKAIFGGDPGLQRQEFLAKFGQKPAAPAPAAASLPTLQLFPPVSAF